MQQRNVMLRRVIVVVILLLALLLGGYLFFIRKGTPPTTARPDTARGRLDTGPRPDVRPRPDAPKPDQAAAKASTGAGKEGREPRTTEGREPREPRTREPRTREPRTREPRTREPRTRVAKAAKPDAAAPKPDAGAKPDAGRKVVAPTPKKPQPKPVRVVLRHVNHMGSAFVLVGLTYEVDGKPVYEREDLSGGLDKTREFEATQTEVPPGHHTLVVKVVYRGAALGLFKYHEGYRYRVRSRYDFNISPNQRAEITVEGLERGGATTRVEDKPSIKFSYKSASKH